MRGVRDFVPGIPFVRPGRDFTMRLTPPRLVVAAGLWALGMLPGCARQNAPDPAQRPVNAEAKALSDFQEKIADYVELHRRLEAELPALSVNEPDAARIQQHHVALSAKIRAARVAAKPGDIFGPAVRAWFRRTIDGEIKKAGGAAVRASMTDSESNPGRIPHQVNATYPESLPVSTVPPALLLSLPRLPDEIEYRFVGTDLILRDTHANVIVDYITGALK